MSWSARVPLDLESADMLLGHRLSSARLDSHWPLSKRQLLVANILYPCRGLWAPHPLCDTCFVRSPSSGKPTTTHRNGL